MKLRCKFLITAGITLFFVCESLAQRNDTPEILSQSRSDLKKSDIYSSTEMKRLFSESYNSPSWIKGSDYVIYLEHANYKIVNAKNGVVRQLFTQKQLEEMFAPFDKKKDDTTEIRFYASRFVDKKFNILEGRAKGVDICYNISRKKMSLIPKKTSQNEVKQHPKQEYWKRFSADSTYYIFGKSHNIYLAKKNESPTKAIRLTDDGVSYYSHTMYKIPSIDTTYKSYRGDWFNNYNIAYGLRLDLRKVTTMIVTNSVDSPVPTYKEYKFELPGDKYVTQYEINLIYADSQKIKRVDINKYPDQEVKLVTNFNKSVNYNSIFFTRRSRTCDTLELCAINPITAAVSVITREVSFPKVNEILLDFAILNGGKEIIWWSERDGKGAFYLYDGNGHLKNRITHGDFVAGKIVSIDTLNRRFIYEGYGYNKGENPNNKTYFKVNFDGTEQVNITPAKGNHSITFSDNKKYFIDCYSTVEFPPMYELRDIYGKCLHKFNSANIDKIKQSGWSQPREITVKAADGVTDLYGVIYRPFDLDTTKKYPIICNVYPGPQSDLVPLTFGFDEERMNSFAQMGFIIIQFGYRGSSPLRGKEFYNYSHDNLRDYALADCKHVVEELSRRYSYIDLERVGIFGHSGGGFLSAAAILTFPDFFKVAVAVSGNHDNNIYAKFWGEVYNGVKLKYEKNSLGIDEPVFISKIATNMELVKNLRGRLFLITGEIDDNVHPANTMRMADELIKNNKRFDMLIMPRLDHGMHGPYYENIIRYYFEEHLKDPKPFNIDIINHQ